MTATPIRKLLAWDPGNLPGASETFRIEGWLRSRRSSKGGFSFLSINDGSCLSSIQVVADQQLDNYEEVVTQLATGAAVCIEGALTASQGAGQVVEIQAQSVDLIGEVHEPERYPIAKKRHTFEYLRSVAHLRPRTNALGAMARVRSILAQSVHRYFEDRGFTWVNTPIITGSDCEGAGELFRVTTLDPAQPPLRDGRLDWDQDFFGQETFLTVSGQLQVESYCLALGKVYTFGPTFRAENSNTSRHLAEFWMIEPEIAFADLQDDADLAEDFLKVVFADVRERCAEDLELFGKHVDRDAPARVEAVIAQPFERMDYGEAITALQASGQSFEFPVEWGRDLQAEHERWLTEQHVGRPVVLMNYPTEIKAFYMRLNDDERTVAAMDVLVPGVGEIIGGSQREERLDVLERRLNGAGIDAEALDWYLDLRRYGTAPHAGFGAGFERLLLYLTGMENIRDVIPFPRVPRNASF